MGISPAIRSRVFGAAAWTAGPSSATGAVAVAGPPVLAGIVSTSHFALGHRVAGHLEGRKAGWSIPAIRRLEFSLLPELFGGNARVWPRGAGIADPCRIC